MSNGTSTKPQETEPQYFTLTIEGQVMSITFRPYYFSNYGHLEFESPHQPPRRILVSKTGYRSHFAPMQEIEEYADIESYAREVAIVLNASHKETPEEKQVSLF